MIEPLPRQPDNPLPRRGVSFAASPPKKMRGISGSDTQMTCDVMKKFSLIVLMACTPLMCSAAGKSASATMQVSFTVVEACSVQGTANTAQVNCAQDTPYQLQARPAASPAQAQAQGLTSVPVTAPSASPGNAEPLTVYF